MLEKIIYLTDETDFMQNTDSGKPNSLHGQFCFLAGPIEWPPPRRPGRGSAQNKPEILSRTGAPGVVFSPTHIARVILKTFHLI